ncbi:LLM class flavin-dependent oxidoreductase [Pseudomonas chlororaphis]|uniref:LLM class flavin-dependent oxidoreductase n=1 Tax=Pseudomonas chlororaphis TaxID=587753 RepID=UPI002408411D|nr:LLM class flavin-dependent oxidoreductase [Pseudomonas chlororaphis]
MPAQRQLKLGAFMRPVSIHRRLALPGAYRDANFNFAHLKRFAQTLERARFDAFHGRSPGLAQHAHRRQKRSHTATSFEPFTLLSALSQATEHIGLVATASTTYDEPFHIARHFSFPRPPEQRPRRLEYRHHRQPRCRAELRLEQAFAHDQRYARARDL